MPKPPPTAPRINSEGLVEYIDIFTGKVVAVSSHPQDSILNHRFDNLIQIDTPEGPVFLERHLDPDRVLRRYRNQVETQPQYSLAWAHLVSARLLAPRQKIDPSHPHHNRVETLTEALSHFKLRAETFTQWRARKEFDDIINASLQAQAQSLQDEALIIARETTDSKALSIKQFQADVLMKQAKQANQQRFGDKQKVEHSGEVAHTILVETGIRRKQTIIPEGFEDAIRDATPIELRGTVTGELSDDQALEEASWPPSEAAPSSQPITTADPSSRQNPKVFKSEDREASHPDQRPPRTSQHAAFEKARPARSFLEFAAESDNSESVAIPDLTDSSF